MPLVFRHLYWRAPGVLTGYSSAAAIKTSCAHSLCSLLKWPCLPPISLSLSLSFYLDLSLFSLSPEASLPFPLLCSLSPNKGEAVVSQAEPGLKRRQQVERGIHHLLLPGSLQYRQLVQPRLPLCDALHPWIVTQIKFFLLLNCFVSDIFVLAMRKVTNTT